MSYCTYIKTLAGNAENLHRDYHDNYYGFPLENDNELFGRLILEINQAGLNWLTILKKAENFRAAYSNFDIHKIANYDDSDFDRLMSDAGIIRNKLKINAAIHNAQKIVRIQEELGSFKAWLDLHSQNTKEEWIKLFKKTFKFTGGEIVNEFLMSTGYLDGAHDLDCPINLKLQKLKQL